MRAKSYQPRIEILESRTLPSQSTGVLDPTFGQGGIVDAQFGRVSLPTQIVLQPDGKILVAGQTDLSQGPQESLFVARFNQDGSSDSSFGTDGSVIIGINDRTNAMGLFLNGGKITVVARTSTLTYQDLGFAVIRLTAMGQLDSSFGTGGELQVSTPGLYTNGAVQEPNGDIIVASGGLIVFSGPPNNVLALTAVTRNGELDRRFGIAGQVVTSLDSLGYIYNELDSIAIQANGDIIVGGTGTSDFSTFQGELVRYRPDGSVDALQTVGVGYVYLVGVAPDQNIVVQGLDNFFNPQMIELMPNLQANTQFNASSIPSYFSFSGIAFQHDGKIVSAGSNGDSFDSLVLMRNNPDGSPDTTFGTGGIVQTTLGYPATATNLAIQPDGKIVVTGIGPPVNYKMILARYGSVNGHSLAGQVHFSTPTALEPGTSMTHSPGIAQLANELAMVEIGRADHSTESSPLSATWSLRARANDPTLLALTLMLEEQLWT